MDRRQFLVATAASTICDPAVRILRAEQPPGDYRRADTDWLAKCRYGIGVHWTAQTFLYTTHQDYWAGELVNLKTPPTSRYLDSGLQWFGWTCLEDRAWVHHRLDTEIPKPLYPDEDLISFVRTCSSHQAPMTFNVGIYQDGTMAPASVSQLHRMGLAFRKKRG